MGFKMDRWDMGEPWIKPDKSKSWFEREIGSGWQAVFTVIAIGLFVLFGLSTCGLGGLVGY